MFVTIDQLVQQFDIVENRNSPTQGRYPFLVVLQHDRTSSLATAVVAPLADSTSALASTWLHPSITVAGRRYVILVEELAAIRQGAIGRVIGTAEPIRDRIIAALDLLFTGF